MVALDYCSPRCQTNHHFSNPEPKLKFHSQANVKSNPESFLHSIQTYCSSSIKILIAYPPSPIGSSSILGPVQLSSPDQSQIHVPMPEADLSVQVLVMLVGPAKHLVRSNYRLPSNPMRRFPSMEWMILHRVQR